jgi:hypothetical protein
MGKIEIPKQYKEDLNKRFDPDRAVCGDDIWRIEEKCPLCSEYPCTSCPISCLQDQDASGCMNLIGKILGAPPHFTFCEDLILWPDYSDTVCRLELRRIREEAEQWIEWV